MNHDSSTARPPAGPDVGAIVEQYEAALARGEQPEVADFAPEPGCPGRLDVLCELIRVDLEHRWASGQPRRLEEYRAVSSELFRDPERVGEMAFEEYRQRLQAGERPLRSEYRDRFGIEVTGWPTAAAAPEPDPEPSPSQVRAGIEAGASDWAGLLRAATAYRQHRDSWVGVPESEPLDAALAAEGVPAAPAELMRSLVRTDPDAAERLAEALIEFPRTGEEFLGFRLDQELGRGAFGRVFLARQADLADRPVALKISADVAGESRALARLRHTNVVPIHSVHRRGPLQAVCMPYLGATTLADTLAAIRTQEAMPRSGQGLLSSLRTGLDGGPRPPSTEPAPTPAGAVAPVPALARPLGNSPTATADALIAEALAPAALTTAGLERLRTLEFVPAVLWVTARIAEGLAHAHERGILHRDLKPSNILFSDDGEPILLDFNLASDARGGVAAAVAQVGGTLPYMAPEQLQAFERNQPMVDARCDIYALGVILHELLTGLHPFPLRLGPVETILPAMVRDRREWASRLNQSHPAITPAVAAIVEHCLAAEPARRYQSARQLHEDLTRQLEDRPLQYAVEPSWRERATKWARRHPRLSSATTVSAIAAGLLLIVGTGWAVQHRRYQGVVATESLRWVEDERRQAVALLTAPELDPELVAEGVQHCRDAAERYGVLDDPGWLERPAVAALPPADRARLRADMGDLLGLWARSLIRRARLESGAERAATLATAAEQLDRAEVAYGADQVPRALVEDRAEWASLSGRAADAEALRLRAQAIPLRTDRERWLVDPRRVDDTLRQQLLADIDGLSGDDARDFAAWMAVGHWNVRLGRSPEAEAAYNIAVTLAPEIPWVRYNRGLFHLERRQFEAAEADFDRVLAARPDLGVALANRALARLGRQDTAGAIADLTRCLEAPDPPSRAWFIRARARQAAGDLTGAQADLTQGLAATPTDVAGFVARGVARRQDLPAALADFDAALALDPTDRVALENKASLLSEQQDQPEAAIALLDRAIAAHPDFATGLSGRGVLHARLGHRDQARADSRAALALDAGGLVRYQAACVAALTAGDDPAAITEALKYLAEAIQLDGSFLTLAPLDPDLGALSGRPEFDELIRALGVVSNASRPR